jgi:hypothetical protein
MDRIYDILEVRFKINLTSGLGFDVVLRYRNLKDTA